MHYNDKGLPPLGPKDILGRSIYSKTRAKRAAKRGVDHHAFLEAEGVTTISVDRLDHASDETMAAISDDVALERSERSGRRQSFYGWATVTVQEASERRRLVHYTPKRGNIYHADIDLNTPVSPEFRDAQKEHANELAAKSKWRPRPEDKSGAI